MFVSAKELIKLAIEGKNAGLQSAQVKSMSARTTLTVSPGTSNTVSVTLLSAFLFVLLSWSH